MVILFNVKFNFSMSRKVPKKTGDNVIISREKTPSVKVNSFEKSLEIIEKIDTFDYLLSSIVELQQAIDDNLQLNAKFAKVNITREEVIRAVQELLNYNLKKKLNKK